MKKSKREYTRVQVSWPVTMLTRKKMLVGEIKDISVSGALIRCEELPSPEETLELSMEVADLSYVSAVVENVRFTVDDSHGDSLAYELAVRFIEMAEDERKMLHNAIEQRVIKKS